MVSRGTGDKVGVKWPVFIPALMDTYQIMSKTKSAQEMFLAFETRVIATETQHSVHLRLLLTLLYLGCSQSIFSKKSEAVAALHQKQHTRVFRL